MRDLFQPNIFVFLVLLILYPHIVLGDCNCNAQNEDQNRSLALLYKLVAMASILVGSLIGVCLPIFGKMIPALSPENDFFFIIKAFAAGVVLATGFIHVLPDAFDSLTSPCLGQNPWGKFPFTGFVAMLAAIGTLMVEVYATSHYNKSGKKSSGDVQVVEDVEHSIHCHTHAAPLSLEGNSVSTELRYRVISQVLEMGMIVHSIIVGIALGSSDSPKTIRPLLAALTFHQFFEGVGLGGCISQAKFKGRAAAVMALFFSFTTPFGIAIGIGINNVYNENSPNSLIVQGMFDAASAGILIYMALVNLLAVDFMSPKMQNNGRLLFVANISLLLGVGCMSLLAKWA